MDSEELALRELQDRAIARASKRMQPLAYPGGVRARAKAELDVADVLRRRHDAHTNQEIADKIVGHEMCGRALLAAAKLDPILP